MGFGEGGGDELLGETDTGFEGVGAGGFEDAVVESATATEAATGLIEGEAGAEEGVDFRRGNDWQCVNRFADSEHAFDEFGEEIANFVKDEGFAFDAGKNPAAVGENFE